MTSGRRFALAGLAIGALLAAAVAVPRTEAQARSSPSVERGLFQTASNVQVVQLDTILPSSDLLKVQHVQLLFGEVHGSIHVAMIRSPGLVPRWVPFTDFMSYLADSNYTLYHRPVEADPSYPPNRRHTRADTAHLIRANLLSNRPGSG